MNIDLEVEPSPGLDREAERPREPKPERDERAERRDGHRAVERTGQRREHDAREPRREFSDRVDGVVQDAAAFRAVAYSDLVTQQFDGHPYVAAQGIAQAERDGLVERVEGTGPEGGTFSVVVATPAGVARARILWARAVRRAGHRVTDVNRGDRRLRRAAGKSDTIDAEAAARSVLAGQSTAIPKTADGAVEIMRQLKVARDTAVKARTAAMITLKQIIVTASPGLRETLQGLTAHALLTRCAGLRPGPLDTPAAAAKHTLRALARRWIALDEEIATHDRHLVRLTTETAPTLRKGFGVGAGTAAEMLILFGDNPDRIRSEAAFAKLCGACPIPASSGRTTGRHRLYRGGHRHANAALYRTVIVRMRFHQPTRDYVARRTADGRTKREIIRCLKRFLAREIYQRVMTDFRTRQAVTQAA